jgi:hypothetical protein
MVSLIGYALAFGLLACALLLRWLRSGVRGTRNQVELVIRHCTVCGATYCMSAEAARLDDGFCNKCGLVILEAELMLRGETIA